MNHKIQSEMFDQIKTYNTTESIKSALILFHLNNRSKNIIYISDANQKKYGFPVKSKQNPRSDEDITRLSMKYSKGLV